MKKLFLILMLLMSINTTFAQQKQSSTNVKKVTYYHDKFHGRKTASGDVYNKNLLTCASTTKYKLGTLLKITNLDNGKSVIVKVNDRGDFSKKGVYLDLSKEAFKQIGSLEQGVLKNIKVEVLEPSGKNIL